MGDSNLQCSSGQKSNFSFKFHRTNLPYDDHQPKRVKVVRFVEEKRDHNGLAIKIKRNCAKTAIDEKLICGDEVSFQRAGADYRIDKTPDENNTNMEQNDGAGNIAMFSIGVFLEVR